VTLPETLPADIVGRAPPQAAAAVGGGLLSMAAGDFEVCKAETVIFL